MHGLTLLILMCSFIGLSHGDLIRKSEKELKPATQSSVNKKELKFNIEITVTQTSDYCGGIRPSQEILNELQNPKPLPLKKLFIKKGDRNIFESKIFREASTDSFGLIQLQLPPGKYIIVDDLKKDTSYYKTLIRRYSKASKNNSAIDKVCLRNWYEQPDMVFEIVNSDLKKLILNFHKPCYWKEIPCLLSNGPLPQ